MRLEVAVSSRVGARKNNEDNFYLDGRINQGELEVLLSAQCERSPAAFGVCDGLGGLAAGEAASEIAVKELRGSLNDAERRARGLEEAIQRMHVAICREAQKRGSRMGAVIAVARITADDILEVCNVGDCRAFVFADNEMTQVSRDHTTEQELLDIGIVTTERGKLTQHLGMEEDEYALEPYMARVPFPPGSELLLCSDGVTQRWKRSEILEILRKAANVGAAAECLTKETGAGQDNATAVVVTRLE